MNRHVVTVLAFLVGAGTGIVATRAALSARATRPSTDLCDIVQARLEAGGSLPSWPSLELCARVYPAAFGYTPPSPPRRDPTYAECRGTVQSSHAPRSDDPLERVRQLSARSRLAECVRLYPEAFRVEPTR